MTVYNKLKCEWTIFLDEQFPNECVCVKSGQLYFLYCIFLKMWFLEMTCKEKRPRKVSNAVVSQILTHCLIMNIVNLCWPLLATLVHVWIFENKDAVLFPVLEAEQIMFSNCFLIWLDFLEIAFFNVHSWWPGRFSFFFVCLEYDNLPNKKPYHESYLVSILVK